MKLRLWTVFSACLLIVGIGFFLPQKISVSSQGIGIDQEAAQKKIMAKEIAIGEDTEDEIEEKESVKEMALNVASPKEEPLENQEDTIIVLDDEPIPLAAPEEKKSAAYTGVAWIDQKISANRDEIDDADLNYGIKIFDSLNQDALFIIADGGMSQEDWVALDRLLQEQLNDSDYIKVYELYYKYGEVLND